MECLTWWQQFAIGFFGGYGVLSIVRDGQKLYALYTTGKRRH